MNVYPVLGGGGGLYDLNGAGGQKSPPGTVAMTSSAPAAAYSFQDILANTHGFVEAGVSTRNGHSFSGGVSIPIVPGKADLDLAIGTDQFTPFKVSGGGKTPVVTLDSYSAGLHLHPTDDVDAYIGFTSLHLRGPAYPPYGYGYP